MSFWLAPCGSVAMSDAPIRANAWVISGTSRRMAAFGGGLHGHRPVETHGRVTLHLDDQRTLVEPRQKFRAQPGERSTRPASPDTHAPRSSVRRPARTDRPGATPDGTRGPGRASAAWCRRLSSPPGWDPRAETSGKARARASGSEPARRVKASAAAQASGWNILPSTPGQPEDGQVDQRDDGAAAKRRRGHLAATGEDGGVAFRDSCNGRPSFGGGGQRAGGPRCPPSRWPRRPAGRSRWPPGSSGCRRNPAPVQPGHARNEGQRNDRDDDQRPAPVAQEQMRCSSTTRHAPSSRLERTVCSTSSTSVERS